MIRIPLLPEGTYARSLANLFLMAVTYYHRLSGKEVSYTGNFLEFEGNAKDISTSFSAATHAIIEVIKERQPTTVKMHKNDRTVISKALNNLGVGSLPQDYVKSFHLLLKAFSRELESNNGCKIISDIMLTKRNKKDVKYGEEGLAPLQVFKLEKYEYGRDFLNLSKIKGDIKLSPYWMAIVAGGWLLSYMGVKGGYLTYSLPPEELIEHALYSREGMYAIMTTYGVNDPIAAYRSDGILSSPSRIRSSSVLPSAYQILLALENASTNIGPEGFSLRIVRVSYDGKRFTVVEDSIINLSTLMDFAKALIASDEATSAVRRLAECAIQGYEKQMRERCKQAFADTSTAIKMINLLYRAAIGSELPERAVYQLARLSPMPRDNFMPPFKKQRVLEWIYKSLAGASRLEL
ncbi:hypothetical protein DRJ17_03155 [Candidatus Woesearchaeota archaeon]|nr:MAG: hypothetical protein DRJ17_03155 [Candidatus Woesearchaeota archaeon]